MLGGIIVSIVVNDEPVMAVFGERDRALAEMSKLRNKRALDVAPLEVIR
jgi:hypothetical protein